MDGWLEDDPSFRFGVLEKFLRGELWRILVRWGWVGVIFHDFLFT